MSTTPVFLRPVWAIAGAFVVCLLLLTCPVRAQMLSISAPNRVDMVHDHKRNILYISTAAASGATGQVLRYDMTAQAFLSPLPVSGNLGGMDISPDGDTLMVADRNYNATNNWVHVVDLTTGLSRRALFPLEFYEGGIYTVAFGKDGRALVSSTFLGSGSVPLRRYDPATDTTTRLASISQWTMLTASGDGSVIGFAEANSSAGPVGIYRVDDGSILRTYFYTNGTGWFNYEIGVNHNGTQMAVPTYGGTFIYDNQLNRSSGPVIGTYAGAQPIGVVYHPFDDIVYFAWATTPYVRAHRTSDFASSTAYNVNHTFQHPGNWAFGAGRLKISRDGQWLFVTVPNAVRAIRLYSENSVFADNLTVSTNEDSACPVTLQGRVRSGGTVTFEILTQPRHGTLTGTAPDLTYTPEADFFGQDSFTYRAKYGSAVSPVATATLNVNPINDPPGFVKGADVTVGEDAGPQSIAGWATAISAGPANESGQTLTFLVTNSNNALFAAQPAISADGTLTFTPAPNASGSATVEVTLKDSGGTPGTDTSAAQTFTIRVSAVNDSPTAVDDTASTVKNTVVVLSVLTNDSDPEGDALMVASVTQGTSGAASINANGTVTYTPSRNFTGTDTFTYTVSDGNGGSDTATVTLTVGKASGGKGGNGGGNGKPPHR